MNLPRFIFNSKARLYYQLWRRERRENQRLKRELLEWQSRLLETKNVRPLGQPLPKPAEPTERAPIGISQKRAWAKRQDKGSVPTAEEILEQRSA